ncbi:unnamed protein product [Euphydryas editha]|uniref:Uncharacterized protein n=1 Tax=Euphydryas editha TaxID=104508 RepID=A0AAU9URP6_EUPED|nr:unnamed protein product [Euphydryas editha]
MTMEANTSIHIENANVADSMKENGTKAVKSCDSEFKNSVSASGALVLSYDTNKSPVKNVENDDKYIKLNDDASDSGALENDGSSEVSTPTSPSSEGKDVNAFELSSSNNNDKDHVSIVNSKLININDQMQVTKDENPHIEGKTEAVDSLKESISLESSNLNGENKITTSTCSLYEPNDQTTNINLCPLSRSADNISAYDTTHENVIEHLNTKDLDQAKILSEFLSQKNKVSATQKIVLENPQIDARYARLPKEILSQDLGSIVKNVHGIFSSVSGSLKNAYNNSHRVVQKPQVKAVKPVANGRIMNEIFEFTDEKSVDLTKLQNGENSSAESVSTPNAQESEQDGNDHNSEMLKLQIESLERVLFEQRKENASLRERVKQQCDELQAKDQTFKELEAKVDLDAYVLIGALSVHSKFTAIVQVW